MSVYGRLPEPLTLLGTIVENWRRFCQESEINLLSSEKEEKDEVKIVLLFNCFGRELLDIYNTLPAEEADKKKYKTLVSKLQEYCEPKKHVTYERYVFNSRVQQAGETVDNFVTDLRKKATDCEFGDFKDDMIRDTIICGIGDETLRGRVLRQGDVTLDAVILQCRADEGACCSGK